MLQTCFLCKYRHVLTLSRRNWLHSAGGQREISQRAQVRGEQREERGAHPQSLSSFWCSVGRSGYRAEKQKPDEACFSEASREQERLGKGLWAQTPGISFTGSLLFVPRYNHWTGRRWRQQPWAARDSQQGICRGAPPAGPALQCSSSSGGRLLSRVPCKAITCNCAQRHPGKEKLQSKPNIDLEVITVFKNEDEEDEEDEDEDEANWLG